MTSSGNRMRQRPSTALNRAAVGRCGRRQALGALARAIERALRHPELGSAAARTARERFGFERMIDDYERSFLAAIGARENQSTV
jgi:hypothetical protein